MRIGSCRCNGKKCDGGFGWKWKTADLGNSIAGNKAGRTWAEPCPEWDGTLNVYGLPPNPPGITNMRPYLTQKWKNEVDKYVGGDE